MRRKREVIKNIKPVFCRFDMDNEQERRAWQIIQKLNKGQEEDRKLSYNNIISQAITGYYDKVTMSHEELLEKVKEIIHFRSNNSFKNAFADVIFISTECAS